MSVADQMNKMILKNCMKYRGLNVKATEFIPESKVADNVNIVPKNSNQNLNIYDDAAFDRLEKDFVSKNAYLFE